MSVAESDSRSLPVEAASRVMSLGSGRLGPPAAPDDYPKAVGSSGVRIFVERDPSTGALLYRVEEPRLSASEAAALEDLDRVLPRILPARPILSSPTAQEERLRTYGIDYLRLHHRHLDPASMQRILYFRTRDALGLGPIDAILRDPEVEDVSCDGPAVPVFVHHARFESVRTNVQFPDEPALRNFVVHLAQRCGRSISVAAPLLDGVTREGHRVQASYGTEVTSRGSTFTLRRFRERPFTPVDLLRNGTASPELVAHLWLAVELGEPFVVIGGSGVGKTSTLNALAMFIPPRSKVVSIEDTRELSLLHEHWVPATTRSPSRPGGSEGPARGGIGMYELLTVALRQRPEYLLVGEVRGAEAVTMFQAMATGHATYATMHADSVRAMVTRLESPPIRVPRALFGSLRGVLLEVQRRTPTGTERRLAQWVEVTGIDPETDDLVTSPVFEWDPEADAFHYQGHSRLLERAALRRGTSEAEVERDLEQRVAWLSRIAARPGEDPRDLWGAMGEARWEETQGPPLPGGIGEVPP